MSNDPAVQASTWVAVCAKCGGFVHEDDPRLPFRHNKPWLRNEPDYCASCWAEMNRGMVADDGGTVCDRCDGTGVIRGDDSPRWGWHWCSRCQGDGVLEEVPVNAS